MSGSSTRFTDNNLKLFYGNLLNHYKDCTRRHQDINVIYNEMYLAVQYAVESPSGSLFHLEPLEKDKVYESFKAIFYSLPAYSILNPQQRRAFNPPRPAFNPQVVYVVTPYNRYDCYDSMLFNWLFLNSITHNCHYSHHHNHHAHPSSGSTGWPSGNHHGHGGSSNNNNNDGSFFAALILIALAACAAILAFIALYYMLNQFANGVERLWYSEGWLKAALMLASSVAFGAGAAVLTFAFVSTPLIGLAIMAGLNPAGVVLIGAILLSAIGAGIGCFAMNLLFDSVSQKMNQDAMDPLDPERFRLTAEEEQSLIAKEIDPIKVKCALVALRSEMANLSGNEKSIPSFFSRCFGSKQNIQVLLQKVRNLRRGELYRVDVGDLSFDCRIIDPTLYQPILSQPQPYPLANANNPGIAPSAPLYEQEESPPKYSQFDPIYMS